MPQSSATLDELSTGINDLEGMCANIAFNYLKYHKAHLEEADLQELIGWVMSSAGIEIIKYNGTGSIRGFLASRLKFRCTDWMRVRFGDDRHRERHQVFSLDVSHEDLNGSIVANDAVMEGLSARATLDEQEASDQQELDHDQAALALGINLATLSEEGKAGLEVAIRMSNGDSLKAIAQEYGKPRSWVERRLELLRLEIEGERATA